MHSELWAYQAALSDVVSVLLTLFLPQVSALSMNGLCLNFFSQIKRTGL